MMSGICYKSSFNSNTNEASFIKSTSLLNRGKDCKSFVFLKHHSLGKIFNNNEDIICKDGKYLIMDGTIFNLKDLTKYIGSTEHILIDLLSKSKHNILEKFNGYFSFVYTEKDECLIVRDIFGAKPLYYTFINNDIFASSEIKSILEYTNERILTKEGIAELLGMGPSSSLGKTIYKGIYSLKPGHCIRINKDGYAIHKYYDIPVYNHKISYDKTVKLTKSLLDRSIISKIKSNNNSSLLSGGLDSSIVTKVLSSNGDCLKTYSITYDNSKFIKTEFTQSEDNDYIKIMVPYIYSHHTDVLINDDELINGLNKMVEYNDGPNMTDIDVSLNKLCMTVKKDNSSTFSGECSDEIFGGYAWFNNTTYQTFPWIRNLDLKEELLNIKYKDKINLNDYVRKEYLNAINEAPLGDDDYNEERKLNYINIRYFMLNLLRRNDYISRYNDLNIITPFCDKDLMEMMYNVPLKYKRKDNINKKILIDAYKDELPEEIINRKKSPYPKTNSIDYDLKLRDKLLEIIDENTVLNEIFDKDKLISFINKDIDMPWYGQLLNKTQFMAYLYQIDYWFKKYKMRLED